MFIDLTRSNNLKKTCVFTSPKFMTYPIKIYFLNSVYSYNIQQQSPSHIPLTLIFIFKMDLSCCRKIKPFMPVMHNRWTGLQIGFSQKQLRVLQKDYLSVSESRQGINHTKFRQQMGILGLNMAVPFSDRLFNSFDLDNDGLINFADFVEYMDILRNGSFRSKSYLSFRMIDLQRSGIIRKKDFVGFLGDLLRAWATITNAPLSQDVSERAAQYVDSAFRFARQRHGAEIMDFQYYYRNVCCDSRFLSAFEFITEGPAAGQGSGSSARESIYEQEFQRVLGMVLRMQKYMEDMQRQQNIIMLQQNTPIALRPHPIPSATPVTSSIRFLHPPPSPSSASTTTLLTAHQQQTLTELQNNLSLLSDNLHRLKLRIEQQNELHMQTTSNLTRLRNNTALTAHRLKKTEGKMVFFGDAQWNLVLNMMIGIQMAIKSIQGYTGPPADFRLKYYFELIPKRFAGDKLRNNVAICKFTDYAPNTFSYIRRQFGITNDEYLKSIGPDRLLASLVMGEMASMTSLTSQGKSGSLFYYSADGQYMLKTVQRRQFKFLKKILQNYFYYVTSNTKTLITRFYGLHKLTERDIKGSTICKHYIIIMANVFNTDEEIVERYDLKGSTHGRMTPKGQFITGFREEKSTKKDLNFLERMPFELDLYERNDLMRILYHDSQFLCSLDIFDYSLLVGVIKKSTSSYYSGRTTRLVPSPPPATDQNQARIYQSRSSNQKYIFGVIDILTHYGARKQIQSLFKRLIYGYSVSAIPPEDYAYRFFYFVNNRVFM